MSQDGARRQLVAWCVLAAIVAAFTAVAAEKCKAPEVMVNGDWSWVNSTTLKYSCKPGFMLAGATTRTCKWHNALKWGWQPHFPPQCHVVCSPPPPDPYGNIDRLMQEKQFFTAGEVVTISCHRPSALSYTLTCHSDGRWIRATCFGAGRPDTQASTPRRTQQSRVNACEDLPPVPGGHREGASRAVGSTVIFKCREGFTLLGESMLTCLDSKEWSASPPVCDVNACEKLPLIPGGHSEGASRAVGSIVSFKCNKGFRLLGESTITCLDTKEWSASPPVCEAFCGRPDPQPNAKLAAAYERRNVYDVDHYAYFHCDTGFRSPSPGFYLYCKDVGGLATWHRNQKCNLEECDDPGDIENGTRSGAVNIHSSVTFMCHPGFRLLGERTLTCLDTKEWSASPPVCEAFCGRPDPQPNAKLAAAYERRNVYDVDHYAYFHCDAGFRSPSPGFYLYCKDVGGLATWHGNQKCNLEECDDPGDIENGTRSGAITIHSSVTFTCHSGFMLVGVATLRCLPAKQWSSPPPECKRFCGEPPAQFHAKIARTYDKKRKFYENETVRYDCDEGYRSPSDGFYLRCVRKGYLMGWDVGVQQCRGYCGEPPVQSHAKLAEVDDNKRMYFENETVRYDCDEGYRSPSDGFHLRCVRKGYLMGWDAGVQQCREFVCGAPPNQTHAKIKLPEGEIAGRKYNMNEYVYVTCDDGYAKLTPGYYMFCKQAENGFLGWVRDQYLQCIPKLCYALNEIEFGFWTGNITLGGSVEYKCQENFTLHGASRLTCNSTTTEWSSDAPRCERRIPE